MEKKLDFHIIALAALGQGLSGGDRIFIEFARRWSVQQTVNLYVWDEGYEMCKRQHLETSNVKFLISKLNSWCRFGFVVCYLARIIEGIKLGLTLKLLTTNYSLPTTIIIYSASEFWMDSLPAIILKIRFGSRIRWVAAWYQTAPNPVKGFLEGGAGGRYRTSALLYWLAQLPIKPLISKFADLVLVNNEEERNQFPGLNQKNKVAVVLGAVDLEKIEKWKKENGNFSKIYDAVFQGRFHPQKGVVELITIWRKVVDVIPNARLAMIGDGPLMESVRSEIKKLKLERNIKLFGYLYDGSEKYKIFSGSSLVVHPAFYDSGGMASAEAMAFGIPCVGFDLKSYKSYYPQGMVKVKVGDLEAFSEAVLNVLDDENFRNEKGKEAGAMIVSKWSWDKRADETLRAIQK